MMLFGFIIEYEWIYDKIDVNSHVFIQTTQQRRQKIRTSMSMLLLVHVLRKWLSKYFRMHVLIVCFYDENRLHESIIGDDVAPVDDTAHAEVRRGRSASSMDMARDSRPRPTRPASMGTPDTKHRHAYSSF
jgi:hypothetical protein